MISSLKNLCMKKQDLYSVSLLLVLVFIFSIQKETRSDGKNKDKKHISADAINVNRSMETNAYSPDAALQWIDLQLELMRTSSPFIGGLPPSRVFAYTGIALYESVVPGMPAYQSLSGQLTEMP